MMSAVSDSSSSRFFRVLRWVGLSWSITLQTLRSETEDSTHCTRSTHLRRREGLRSFPRPLLSGSACPGPGQQWFAVVRSPAQASSGASPGLVEVESAVLAPPPVVSVVGDADLTYCLTDALTTGYGNFDLPELLSTCSGLCPFIGISASLQYIQYLIFQPDTFEGGRSFNEPRLADFVNNHHCSRSPVILDCVSGRNTTRFRQQNDGALFVSQQGTEIECGTITVCNGTWVCSKLNIRWDSHERVKIYG
jgi:hypothetical protein